MKRGLLAGVNEQLRTFHRRVLQNPVAKIQNMSMSGKLGGDIKSRLANFFRGGKQNGGVEIPPQGPAPACPFANFGQRNTPVPPHPTGSPPRPPPHKML